MAHRLMGGDAGEWTAVCRNASLEECQEEAIFMAVHRRPAAAAQVSICDGDSTEGILLVIVLAGPFSRSFSFPSRHAQDLAFCVRSLCPSSNHRNKLLACGNKK